MMDGQQSFRRVFLGLCVVFCLQGCRGSSVAGSNNNNMTNLDSQNITTKYDSAPHNTSTLVSNNSSSTSVSRLQPENATKYSRQDESGTTGKSNTNEDDQFDGSADEKETSASGDETRDSIPKRYVDGKRLRLIKDAIKRILKTSRRLKIPKAVKSKLPKTRSRGTKKQRVSGRVIHTYVSDKRGRQGEQGENYENYAEPEVFEKPRLTIKPQYSSKEPSGLAEFYRHALNRDLLPYQLLADEIPFQSIPRRRRVRRPLLLYYPDDEGDVRYGKIPTRYPSSEWEDNRLTPLDRVSFMPNYDLRALEELQTNMPIFGCDPNPCLHGGECHRTRTKFHCACKEGFAGVRCHNALKKARCRPNPCLNGGSCTDMDDGYECTCMIGYKGHTCEEEAQCKREPCLNGGTCTELHHGYQCTCPPGYHGNTCQEQSFCYNNPCRNGGTCTETGTDYVCICKAGWSCHDCGCQGDNAAALAVKRTQDVCFPDPCRNGGSCFISGDSFRCFCQPGYKGESCERTDFCASDPCLNDGFCKETPTGYHCACRPEFRGRNCETENHCKPRNPCENQGVCVEREDSYKCHCKLGYKGFNCEEREFCKPNPCKSGGVCLPDKDTYMCTCPPGYKGKNCDLRDMCASAPCLHQGTCVDLDNNSYKCLCSQEWHGNQCEVKNPCYPNPCSNNGQCETQDGHSVCHCEEGYKGDTCTTKDLCRPNPCHHHGECIQHGPDFYECDCAKGYSGNTCQDMDPCFSNPCMYGGTCQRQGKSDFRCLCNEGRIGQYCEVRDPCMPSPCHNGAICSALDKGNYKCDCHSGFVGPSCSVVDPCMPSPCHNNGSCVNTGIAYTCHCPPKYYGQHCQSVSRCTPNPCLNDGTCRDVNAGRGFVCYCSIAYLGPNCERPNLCHPDNPCKNGGTCKTDGSTVACHCREGYLGSHCEQLNFCHGNPCKNGGTCTPKLDGYECDCPVGFFGKKCDAKSGPCMPSPCKNGGLCAEDKSIKEGYMCVCKGGFLGKTCDRNDNCSPNPCLHNGTCLQAVTNRGYHCLCHKGWHGYQCQREDHCYPSPCMNGGTCFNTEMDGSICRCPMRYMGTHCGVDKCLRCDDSATCVNGTCECRTGFLGNGFKCTAASDPCLPNPCENGGMCRPGHGGRLFECGCPSGYDGERCEVPKSACDARPCYNGGTCVDITNDNGTILDGITFRNTSDFRCVCSRGYAGHMCERLVLLNPCSTHPCKSGGTCYDHTNSARRTEFKLLNGLDYRCFCRPGTSGKNCQAPHEPCQSNPCLNGGMCIDRINAPDVAFSWRGFQCICNGPFKGTNCEEGCKEVSCKSRPPLIPVTPAKIVQGSKVLGTVEEAPTESPPTQMMTVNEISKMTGTEAAKTGAESSVSTPDEKQEVSKPQPKSNTSSETIHLPGDASTTKSLNIVSNDQPTTLVERVKVTSGNVTKEVSPGEVKGATPDGSYPANWVKVIPKESLAPVVNEAKPASPGELAPPTDIGILTSEALFRSPSLMDSLSVSPVDSPALVLPPGTQPPDKKNQQYAPQGQDDAKNIQMGGSQMPYNYQGLQNNGYRPDAGYNYGNYENAQNAGWSPKIYETAASAESYTAGQSAGRVPSETSLSTASQTGSYENSPNPGWSPKIYEGATAAESNTAGQSVRRLPSETFLNTAGQTKSKVTAQTDTAEDSLSNLLAQALMDTAVQSLAGSSSPQVNTAEQPVSPPAHLQAYTANQYGANSQAQTRGTPSYPYQMNSGNSGSRYYNGYGTYGVYGGAGNSRYMNGYGGYARSGFSDNKDDDGEVYNTPNGKARKPYVTIKRNKLPLKNTNMAGAMHLYPNTKTGAYNIYEEGRK